MQHKTNTLTTFITRANVELEEIRDGLRGAILALEVERAAIVDTTQEVEADLQAILGLGVLLKDLHLRKLRVEELGRLTPSPNKLTGRKIERTIELSKKLFETAEHIRNIQNEAYRLAKLNMRAAAHKLGHQKKLCVA